MIGSVLSAKIIILRTRKSAIVQIVSSRSPEVEVEEEIHVDINQVIGSVLSAIITILQTRKSAIELVVSSQNQEVVVEEILVDINPVSQMVSKTPI